MDPIPSVVAFSGHLTDTPERASPRFPEARVARVRTLIRERLLPHGASLVGVCSAARGGDLLFLEQLLDLGGRAVVLLPFPPADFKRSSVGQGWDEQFERTMLHPRVELRAPLHAVVPDTDDARDEAFAQCNTAIVETTLELAGAYGDSTPWFLAVYQKSAADRTGGTLDAFERWNASGHRLVLIDPNQ